MSETMEPKVETPEYWTTLSEYDRDIEYLAHAGEEFYPEAKPQKFFDAVAEDEEKILTPMQRRTFLQLSGFAALATALSGCERPVQEIVPYVNKPMDVTIGIANYYASSLGGPEGLGLLIKSREGRPIKLEGNPDHPLTKGGLSALAQAEILKLYNPDRLRFPVRVGRKGNDKNNPKERIANFDQEIGEAIKNTYGKVVLLTPTIHGPANKKVVDEFRKSCRAFEHVTYDAMQDGLSLKANEECFGVRALANTHYDKADTMVFLGADPLVQSPNPTATNFQIGAKYHPDAPGGMARIYSFEPVPTLSGMKADYRYQVHPAHLLEIGLALANEIIVARGNELTNGVSELGAVRGMLANYTISSVATKVGVSEENLKRVADSLLATQGHSIVSVDGAATRTEDGYALRLVANLLNFALGNYGKTLDLEAAPANYVAGSHESMLKLIDEMNSGDVDMVITWGMNPAYTLPADAGFAAALAKVKKVVSLSLMMDETMALCDIAIPGVHSLEAWGDAEPVAGLYNLQQPAIRPIFGPDAADPTYESRTWQESLMAFSIAAGSKDFTRELTAEELASVATAEGVEVGELSAEQKAPKAVTFLEFLKGVWEKEIFSGSKAKTDFNTFWLNTLQLGFSDQRRESSGSSLKLNASALSAVKPAGGQGMTFVALPTTVHGDGESMGIPHLLEMPDPITKVSWENYVILAPTVAESLRVKDGDHVRLTVEGREVEGPVRIQPGIHKDVVCVYLGWGRDTRDGIGHQIGLNAYSLLKRSGDQVIYSGLPAQVERGSGRTKLADSQGHHYLYSPDYGGVMVNKRKGEVPEGATLNESGKPVYERPIIGETTLNEWKKNPEHGNPNHADHGEEIPSMWGKKHTYLGHKWGMTVDLNSCTGCNACMVACNIENNIPVVGKEELAMGREMFWIRIDRYYRGSKENPDFVNMPLMCHHCDNAPCETVCPVVATLHNDEGLNLMVYNRCVGTRYCANNCPYKVRRFNFWQYSDYRTGPKENKKIISPLEMVLNPDVTTRSRGVMEKCTFCQHRIRVAKETARMAGRQLEDGEMQTACQQTCPAKAITFGDRNDPNSQVAKNFEDKRSYGLLEDLNVDPSVRYMALVRNRDEPTPYRTKYQAHRVDHHGDEHGSDATGHEAHGSDDNGHSTGQEH